ncbi:MAG: hypothetical protein IJA34_13850 [Lachnospiraceae bacterium]|nr:hypothetical protein [Lachnospiraceae bacterium]
MAYIEGQNKMQEKTYKPVMQFDEEFEILEDLTMTNTTKSVVKEDDFKVKTKDSKTKTSSPKLKKILKVVKNFARIKKEEDVRNSADFKSMEEKQALGEMCAVEKQIPHATKEFKEILDLVEEYTKSKGYDNEQATLKKAMKEIENYISKNSVTSNDNEYELLERVKAYSYYFETKSNGTLSGYEHKKGEKVKNPDAGKLNIWKDVSDYKLFPHEPSVNDIKQRRTEDCYMLSSLSAIALSSPHIIKQSVKDNGDGTVTVRFYDNKDKILFHNDLTLDDIYKQVYIENKITEMQANVMALTKMISKYFQDKEFIDEYLKNVNEKGTEGLGLENKEKAKEVVEQVEEKVEKQIDSELDLDDFGDMEELEIKSSTKTKSNDNLKAIQYQRKVDNFTGTFSSNNEQWYKSVIERCLTTQGKTKDALEKVLNKIKEAKFDENVQKDYMKKLLDEIINDDKLSGDFTKITDECTEDKLVNKEVFVTVSKEISTIAGVVEKNATDSLWVQMIEKAYAYRYGGDKGYAGISRDNSSVFLERFLNKSYVNKAIIKREAKDIKEGEKTIISKSDIFKAIKASRSLSKEGNAYIENVMKVIVEQDKYASITKEEKELIIKKLGEDFGIMHKEFSGKYNEKALDIFENVKNRLERKEVITVGIKGETIEKDRLKALNDSGIRVGHAYAVLGCYERGKNKFVTLRDPYGLFRREYEKTKYSDGEKEYKKVNASKISLAGTDTMGTFNMELNDFLATFDTYSGILKV